MVFQPEMPSYAIEFFSLFARLEYAMKAEGMWSENPKTGQISPNWTQLEKRGELTGILDTLAANETAKYLLAHPPKKLKAVDGRLEWSEAPPPITTVEQLSVMIRRVRNNLFHGSKSMAGTERDEQLLRACTVAIREIAGRLPQIDRRFYPEG